MGVVDGQPAHHVGVDCLELRQRGVGIWVAGCGFELQQVAGKKRAVENHSGIPQRIAAVQQHEQDQFGGEQADQAVACSR